MFSPSLFPPLAPVQILKTTPMKIIRNKFALLAIVIAGLTTTYAQDPLPSWNDGPAKQAIVDFVKATTETGGFVAGNQKLLAEIVWPHFWAIQIILFVLIVMYCMMHELVRVIGKEKALRIFFGPMPAPEV